MKNAETNVTSRHQKVSGGTAGMSSKPRTDKEASNAPVHKSAQGVKPGVAPGFPYSGPPVARISGH